MRLLLCSLILSLLSQGAFAGYQGCPGSWLKENSETYDLLSKMRGVHQVGDCKLEIRLCDSKASPTTDAQVADVLIIQGGKEYYVPLYIDADSATTSSSLSGSHRGIVFTIKDKNSDPLSGGLEKDRLTMTLNYGKTEFMDVTLMRKTNHEYSKVAFWKLPKIFSCGEKYEIKE